MAYPTRSERLSRAPAPGSLTGLWVPGVLRPSLFSSREPRTRSLGVGVCAPGRGRIPRRRPPPPPSGRTPGPRRRAGGGAAEAELRQTRPRRGGGTWGPSPTAPGALPPSLPPSLPAAGGDPQRAGEELRRPPDRLQVLRRRKGGGELREPGGRSLLKSYAAPCRATRSAAPPPQPAGPVAELRGGRSRSPIQGLRQVSASRRRGLRVWPEFTSELGRAGEGGGE